MPPAERADYGEVVLEDRLRDALVRLNPGLPAEALDEASRKLTRPEGADLVQRNRAVHRLLVDGVTVEDGATVPIYSESRLAKLGLDEAERPRIDPELEEVTEGEDLEHAVRQIISRAVAPEGVMDIFAAAGLEKPDISILSEEFLAEVRGMPQRNLAVELLQKLLKGEIRTRRRKNVVQARSFAEMLEQTIRKYQNRSIEAAQVIEELIQLAREMREANARGESLGLTEDELAFYDALETNDSAVKVLGDEILRGIARELVTTIRNNVTIDWTLRENVRARLRVLVKRILRKHGYPPDKQEKATQTVLEQAALLSAEWAA